MTSCCFTSQYSAVVALFLITSAAVSYLLLYKSIALNDNRTPFVVHEAAVFSSFAADGGLLRHPTWRQGHRAATASVLLLPIESWSASSNRQQGANARSSIHKYTAVRHLLDAFKGMALQRQKERDVYLAELIKTRHHDASAAASARISTIERTEFPCGDLDRRTTVKELGRGYTKRVDEVSLGLRRYAVKYAARSSVDISRCIAQHVEHDICLARATAKVEDEASLMAQLSHPNVVKVLWAQLDSVTPFRSITLLVHPQVG